MNSIYWRQAYVPTTMTRAYHLEGLKESGEWITLYETRENHQRLNNIELTGEFKGVRLPPLETWDSVTFRLFSFDVR